MSAVHVLNTHQKMGAVSSSILINTSDLDPFAPIIKTPNYAKNSGNQTGYSIEIADDDSLSGYRHLGNVFDQYLLLGNAETRSLSLEIAEGSGLPFEESRIFFDGKRFMHVIDFDEGHYVDDDEIHLGLVTQSSYDRSWRYRIMLMGKRVICSNGMISTEFFQEVNFKHIRSVGDGSWPDVVRAGLSLLDQLPVVLERLVEMLRYLRAVEMTEPRMRRLWGLFPTLGDSLMGQIMRRYVENEEATLYGVLNAGTYVFWHANRLKVSDIRHIDRWVTTLFRVRDW